MNNMHEPVSTHALVTPPRSLTAAVRRLLRPLVKLLLHYSVQYPALASLLKLTYVEVATTMPVDGKPQTDSRVSLLTGIHRLDVKRLRNEIVSGNDSPPMSVSLGAQIVARWTAHNEYLDNKGRPLPLHRLASVGGAMSFESLVRSVSKDIRPRVVLDEWLRLGVAQVDSLDRVVLVTDAFVPSHGLDEKLFYLGKNVHDHLDTCAHNLTRSDAPPLLERSVYYDHLSKDSTMILSIYARQLSSQTMQAFSQKAMELQERDHQDANARYRVSYGQYFHQVGEQEDRT
ncbi:MAG: hypothetical protein KKA22_14270 [Gammaproteobacteria bacterium]|jgi:hypothetical protein|nr:hypothetical protein [Gammaproteobacteria bacterium]MBU1409303.1 hypothetical protein [Gammaproteobacteria bacterium]MBU1531199.1 hypothetical protein [Gammaproteobacteria bacterium]